MKHLTIEGEAARSLAKSIEKARAMWPVLENASDEEVVSILLNRAFALQDGRVSA